MNTLRDTDEGRARPSVWPVYVAAGVLLISGAWTVYSAIDILGALYLLPSVWGILGLLAAFGLLARRPWGWWSAAVWTVALIGFAVRSSIPQYMRVYGEVAPWAPPVIALLVWALATRRRLFFPPKPAGEE